MCGAWKGADLSSMGAEPEARITCFAVSSRRVPSGAVNSTRRPGSSLPCPCSGVTPLALEEREDALCHRLDDAALALLHLGDIHS